jgi:hypothetical protein
VSPRRLLLALGFAAAAGAAVIGCGFRLADDSGKPIPGPYWGWACPDGGAPDGPGGCVGGDAGADDAGDAAGAPADGAARDSQADR